jgi:beta-xylosidase
MASKGSRFETSDVRTANHGAYPWVPDQGDGTYRNPILYADYSDPDVIRHGDDFYLTASSFHCTPGLPLLHSHDLVNWTLINHAVQNLPHSRYAAVRQGQGIWAPALRHHADRFWIFFATPDEGVYVTTADNPKGHWSEPHLVQAGRGLIDPCPFWDDDGRAYLIHAYAESRSGIKHRLRVRPMAPDGSRLLGEGRIVFDAPERHPIAEGPKFIKRDGWYYILAPAGGVENGWQLALRSRDIYGPYEEKVVLEQGRTPVNGPHQGALVDTPAGEAWFLHFQDAGVYGRITHLQPVHWQDGWPLMGVDNDGNGVGEPVAGWRKPRVSLDSPMAVPATSDLFLSETLGLQWQWNANHEPRWYSLQDRPGHLRLFSQSAPDDLRDAPGLLLQKFPARSFTVESSLEFFPAVVNEEAGLVVLGRQVASLGLLYAGDGFRLVCRTEGAEAAYPVASSSIRLGVRVGDGSHCQFTYASGDDAGWTPIGIPFQADKGHWIGARVGLYSITQAPNAGYADFSSFQFHKTDEPA